MRDGIPKMKEDEKLFWKISEIRLSTTDENNHEVSEIPDTSA